MNPTEEEILNAINASGYLFEQEIGSVIEKHDYYIQTNVAFKDSDEEISREIDVKGYKRIYNDEEKKISIGVTLLCECKKNQNPFVFINRNKSAVDELYSPPNFLFHQEKFHIPKKEKPGHFDIVTAFKYFKLNKVFPYSVSDKKAVQFCKILRKGKDWNASHEGVYDSILLPLIKCLEYFKKADSKMIGQAWKNYFIYFPIVVLNSDLYSLDSHSDPTKLNTQEYISFTRDIDSKNIKDRYLVDFVTKKGLENYLKHHVDFFVEKFIEHVIK